MAKASGRTVHRRAVGNSARRGVHQRGTGVLKRPAAVVRKKPSQRAEYLRTPYRLPGATSPDRPRLNRIVGDVNLPELLRLSETAARRRLSLYGFLPSSDPRKRKCYACGGKVTKFDTDGRKFFRCTKKTCRAKTHMDSYTPLVNRGGGGPCTGGGSSLTASEYLAAAWAFAYRSAPDVTTPMTGVSEKKVHRVFDYLRCATAASVEQDTAKTKMDDGVIELDTGRAVGTRVDTDSTEHRGRTLVAVSRQTGEAAYARVPNRKVKKGAPTPPETMEEVWPAAQTLLGDGAIVAADGANAWKKVAKRMNLGPVASSSHARKEWVNVVKLPAPPKSAAKKILEDLGHGNKRTLRVKGGDQMAEAALGAVKSTARRRNMLKNARHAGSNMLSAAFLRDTPGIRALGRGVGRWLEAVVDEEDPSTYWVVGEQHPGDEPVA